MHDTETRPTVRPVGSAPKKFSCAGASFRWTGVEPQAYKFSLGDIRGMGWRDVTRFTLAGPPAWPVEFELRYFELAPGGYSSFEKHTHPHIIIALRGQGRAVVGRELFTLDPFDIVQVPPQTPHRWLNEGHEPFGFLCPVDAHRDAPQPLSTGEWAALRDDPTIAPYVF
jgi:quercetin dioxygenase-like cupin family protein